ncbi:MAG: transglycosylase domain-containing protein [Desulfobacterales bacterium]|jgi:penicillin-binding protein 1C
MTNNQVHIQPEIMFRSKTHNIWIPAFLLVVITMAGAFIWKTRADLLPMPTSLSPHGSGVRKVQVVDRNDAPFTITYQNRWNIHELVSLHNIPHFLQRAFIVSEDKRFYRHNGVDWSARLHALFQNIKALKAVRGASTISEQVIRMWHPRPRTLWSRWLEGIEAGRLEKVFSKKDIFEFYLNQIPYAGQRRGLVQAARDFFDRDLDTLSFKEMLALVVMVRSPVRLDVRKNPTALARSTMQLAGRLFKYGVLDKGQHASLCQADIRIREASLPVTADHFVQYLQQMQPPATFRSSGRWRTTLDTGVQHIVQTILDHRLMDLKNRGARNGAVLVVDHWQNEVLAWANSGAHHKDVASSWFDAVITPRQPGSTLKPFLYALALSKGWTAATLVDDSPLSEPVGRGLHAYHNYSRMHYGLIRVRQALGNSLNIPAVRAIQFVGVESFLDCLHQLGIRSLQQHPDYYGDGLALGNGEITLLELVQAYTVLARQGIYRPLRFLMDEIPRQEDSNRIFSAEIASLIGNILSDPEARRLEFDDGSLLRFPVQTAIKTGTSSDYRDAWAIGFNHGLTVGVWIGNLDHEATEGITGANGPALVLRSIFAELNHHRESRPLYLSPLLVKAEICRDTGLTADGNCASTSEWFVAGSGPGTKTVSAENAQPVFLRHPSEGMQLAMDPRIPDDQEAFVFKLANLPHYQPVDWYVDGRWVASTSGGKYLWNLQPGPHTVSASVPQTDSGACITTPEVNFLVK